VVAAVLPTITCELAPVFAEDTPSVAVPPLLMMVCVLDVGRPPVQLPAVVHSPLETFQTDAACAADGNTVSPAVPASNIAAASLLKEPPLHFPRAAACSDATTHEPLLTFQIVLWILFMINLAGLVGVRYLNN
jgi:hypothetical protein